VSSQSFSDRSCLRQVSPLTVPDWNARVLTAPHTSIFHSTNWLQVLQASYGYQPFYFADFEGETLMALLPFMEVKSWLTGVRGVSLPFSDYCEPVLTNPEDLPEGLAPVIEVARRRQWQCLEIRGGHDAWRGVAPYTWNYRHVLTLSRHEDVLFSRLRSNYRAKIRKACRNDLKVHLLDSLEAMDEYYRLHCLTRKRHGLLPQPRAFFVNVHNYLISQNLGFVVLVSHHARSVAGAVFLHFGNRAVYKFGASDMRYRHLYPNYLLFWHAICQLCRNGYKELCFGRTTPSNHGLIQFKAGWGTKTYRIHTYKYNLKTSSFVHNPYPPPERRYRICQQLPLPLLRWGGALLYPHIG
jgi:CelD/BcsL family acetyltransferase involved in cellulose biosynthesis